MTLSLSCISAQFPTTVPTSEAAHVLLVDDDPIVLQFSQRALERAGHTVTVANDGIQAVATLSSGEFDLVVSDVDMPRMDGIALLCAVQEINDEIPVILVTGSPRIETAVSAVNHGAVRYLTKPFESEELVYAVDRAIRARRLDRLRKALAASVVEQHRALAEDRERFESAIDQLYMVFQPIVHWPTRLVHGYEALVRTNERSIPHPGALFEASTRLDETLRLGRKIRRACANALSEAPEESLLFVNLHARDLRDPELTDPSSPLAQMADRVVLEVAEHASAENIKDAARCIEELRALGFRIAIDDIGAGYAGLNSFALLEPDVVKLDMALVRGVNESRTKQRLIDSFVRLCKTMGILVVAEGVETEAELRTLLDIGCELFQGYLLARPDTAFRTSVSWVGDRVG